MSALPPQADIRVTHRHAAMGHVETFLRVDAHMVHGGSRRVSSDLIKMNDSPMVAEPVRWFEGERKLSPFLAPHEDVGRGAK